jgi:amino acid transporter
MGSKVFSVKLIFIISFSFSDIFQLVSILINFGFLVDSSSKLFFSQRLGRYSDQDPTWKMKALVIPLIIPQLAGSLMVLILFAAYQKAPVIILVLVTIVINLIILFKKYFIEKRFVVKEYEHETKLRKSKEDILKSKEKWESSQLFFKAVLRFSFSRKKYFRQF